ncbi:MAG: NUDIX domain-containing protein [Acidobacteria bacterium]|nr:NUDIX domain-containing protein [Acidobacteriota bacterium]
MSKSAYQENIRQKIGHDLLLMPGVAAVIRDREGRVLVQQSKKGYWNLPAGAVDPGEKPAQAIVREVFEETGLVARPVALIAVTGGGSDGRTEYDNRDVVESTTIIFACDVVGGELKPQDDETLKLEYFAVDDLPPISSEYKREIFSIDGSSAFFEWDDSWLEQATSS